MLCARSKLERWVQRDKMRLAQQAKKKWLNEGDQNSKYFHAIIALRRRNSSIKTMRLLDGSMLNSLDRVHEGAARSFEDFFLRKKTGESCRVWKISFGRWFPIMRLLVCIRFLWSMKCERCFPLLRWIVV